MKMEDTIILRIISSAGRSRISCQLSDLLITLHHKLSSSLKIPMDQITLFFDAEANRPVGMNEYETLSDLGIRNGDLLYLRSNTKGVITGAHLRDPCNKMTTNDLESICNKQVNTAKNKSDSDNLRKDSDAGEKLVTQAGFRKTDRLEPTFKSFDQFLMERGFNFNDLPGVISYLPTVLKKGQMTKVPQSITLKHQPYRHVDHLELMNIEEIKSFVNYWRYDLEMCEQRGGFMYGYYVEDNHYAMGIRAVCEAIYEPPQMISNSGSVELIIDKEEKSIVDQIAAHVGLELIGWIYTHLPRDQLLTAEEVLHIAKLQLQHMTDQHYTSYPVSKFVTCTITPDAKNGGEPVPNAFMVSDMGMALMRDNIISEIPSDISHIELRRPGDRELLPKLLESGNETTMFDADWFVVRVNESAPIKVRSVFKQNHFPCENRKIKQKPSHVRDYFNSTILSKTCVYGASSKENYNRFSDFHLLLYVAKLFDIETALSICDCIYNKQQVDPGLEDILKSIP